MGEKKDQKQIENGGGTANVGKLKKKSSKD